jgi:acyl-CoA synthetase (AMP-forming)/AMP-acid ligase II
MDRWSPSGALELIEQHGVSFMIGPPTFFVDLMNDPEFDRDRVGSLRLISSGGAGVTSEFVDRASDAFGATVKRAYGSTEAPTVATSTTGDDPQLARDYDGHAIGEAELRIVDGELQVRGPELFAGYLSVEDTAAAMTEDGWFRTGDLATLTDDGWLRITGRIKDIIIRAGENISIREVEDTLVSHPNVEQAVVVGLPDARLGEQVAALVITRASSFTVADAVDWFEKQGLARFKTPERVIVVTAIPVLTTGKVDRVEAAAIARSFT